MTGCRLSLCSDVLRDLLPFAQFEKREKDPWEVLHLGNFTKINTPSWLFSRFLNCRNGAKLLKNHKKKGYLQILLFFYDIFYPLHYT